MRNYDNKHTLVYLQVAIVDKVSCSAELMKCTSKIFWDVIFYLIQSDSFFATALSNNVIHIMWHKMQEYYPATKLLLMIIVMLINTTVRVNLAQSSSLNLFISREAEYEQRAQLLKRLSFVIFCSEIDQYQRQMPEIQGI